MVGILTGPLNRQQLLLVSPSPDRSKLHTTACIRCGDEPNQKKWRRDSYLVEALDERVICDAYASSVAMAAG